VVFQSMHRQEKALSRDKSEELLRLTGEQVNRNSVIIINIDRTLGCVNARFSRLFPAKVSEGLMQICQVIFI